MADLALLLIGALLVNNFVLAQFLGLCPFMGITKGYDTALADWHRHHFCPVLFRVVCAPFVPRHFSAIGPGISAHHPVYSGHRRRCAISQILSAGHLSSASSASGYLFTFDHQQLCCFGCCLAGN